MSITLSEAFFNHDNLQEEKNDLLMEDFVNFLQEEYLQEAPTPWTSKHIGTRYNHGLIQKLLNVLPGSKRDRARYLERIMNDANDPRHDALNAALARYNRRNAAKGLSGTQHGAYDAVFNAFNYKDRDDDVYNNGSGNIFSRLFKGGRNLGRKLQLKAIANNIDDEDQSKLFYAASTGDTTQINNPEQLAQIEIIKDLARKEGLDWTNVDQLRTKLNPLLMRAKDIYGSNKAASEKYKAFNAFKSKLGDKSAKDYFADVDSKYDTFSSLFNNYNDLVGKDQNYLQQQLRNDPSLSKYIGTTGKGKATKYFVRNIKDISDFRDSDFVKDGKLIDKKDIEGKQFYDDNFNTKKDLGFKYGETIDKDDALAQGRAQQAGKTLEKDEEGNYKVVETNESYEAFKKSDYYKLGVNYLKTINEMIDKNEKTKELLGTSLGSVNSFVLYECYNMFKNKEKEITPQMLKKSLIKKIGFDPINECKSLLRHVENHQNNFHTKSDLDKVEKAILAEGRIYTRKMSNGMKKVLTERQQIPTSIINSFCDYIIMNEEQIPQQEQQQIDEEKKN